MATPSSSNLPNARLQCSQTKENLKASLAMLALLFSRRVFLIAKLSLICSGAAFVKFLEEIRKSRTLRPLYCLRLKKSEFPWGSSETRIGEIFQQRLIFCLIFSSQGKIGPRQQRESFDKAPITIFNAKLLRNSS